MPYASMIPMSCLAAILIMVAYNMSGWRSFAHMIKTAPRSDTVVLVLTFLLTVFFDLVVAIEVGMVLAALLFMKRMADINEVKSWIYTDDENQDVLSEQTDLKQVPDNTLVYELNGPLFFGAANNFLSIIPLKGKNALILRMRNVPAMDITGMSNLEEFYETCRSKKIQLILSHVNDQPKKVMQKAGFTDKLGEEYVCPNIDTALAKAASLKAKK